MKVQSFRSDSSVSYIKKYSDIARSELCSLNLAIQKHKSTLKNIQKKNDGNAKIEKNLQEKLPYSTLTTLAKYIQHIKGDKSCIEDVPATIISFLTPGTNSIEKSQGFTYTISRCTEAIKALKKIKEKIDKLESNSAFRVDHYTQDTESLICDTQKAIDKMIRANEATRKARVDTYLNETNSHAVYSPSNISSID